MTDSMIYGAIAALSAAVIISYVFSLISIKTRIPTVLMLLALGIAARQVAMALDLHVAMPLSFLQLLGVLGLVVILLEAGLDLTMTPQKIPLIRRASTSALLVLVATVAALAALLGAVYGTPWPTSLLYAVPLGVVSSTIVASSIQHLTQDKREFLTYESSLSDIVGILAFNFLVAGESFSIGLIAVDLLSIVVALLLSVVISVGLVFLLARVNVNIKAFLIFAVLLLIYSLGHAWQLPTLVTVLVFGLIVNNWPNTRFRPLQRHLHPGDVESASASVKAVTAESAFLIRTVFFIAFGYSIDITQLWNPSVILIGSAITALIVAVRFAYTALFNRRHFIPEVFFTPRGLVTIVLFYSIPESMRIPGFHDAILLYVVLMTTLVMMIGSIWITPRSVRREASPKVVADRPEP